MKHRLAFLLAFLSGLLCVAANAATYYVSPGGSDSNNGTTPATAWQTLSHVNSQKFLPGDQILFQSGQTFAAPSRSDALIISGSGTASNPVVYGIYSGTTPGICTGTTPAVISQSSSSKNGVTFSSTNAWVTLQDLEIAGPFVWSSTTSGAQTPYGVHLQGSSSLPLLGTTIQRVLVHNFAGSGIRSNENENLNYTTIQYTQAYQLGDAGIRLGSDDDTQGGQFRNNIYIGHCQAYECSGYSNSNLHSGDGILVQCAKNVTIEYCVAHDTGTAFVGTGGGPVGIWMCDTESGTIQYCESYNNSHGTAPVDGDGFDLDGGCQDSFIQYCYAHDNAGAGFLLCHWATSSETASPTSRNTIRYNISVNDSKSTAQAGLSFCSANAAATLDNRAYNNLVVQARPGSNNAGIDQFDGGAVGTSSDPTRIYNNIFISGTGHLLANTKNSSNFIIKNNVWWSLNNTFSYSGGSLAATDPAGIQADPKIVSGTTALLAAPTVGYASIGNMQQLLSGTFGESAGSSATDVGANLSQSTYGSLTVGFYDFFGTPIPQGCKYDIGPFELTEASPDLTLSESLSGALSQGETDAVYTITVTNSGSLATTGTISLADFLPSGLTAVSMIGTGWTINLSTLTATRSDTLPAGASYPPLTLSVNVAINAPTSVSNVATISGGGEPTVMANTGTNTSTVALLTPIQSWRYQWFGSIANSGPGADTAINAGDGVPNLMKYAFGQNPFVSSTNPVTVDAATGFLRMTVSRNPLATDLTFSVQVTSDLSDAANWTTEGITVNQNTPVLLQVSDNTPLSTTGRRFIRLQVTDGNQQQ